MRFRGDTSAESRVSGRAVSSYLESVAGEEVRGGSGALDFEDGGGGGADAEEEAGAGNIETGIESGVI